MSSPHNVICTCPFCKVAVFVIQVPATMAEIAKGCQWYAEHMALNHLDEMATYAMEEELRAA